MGWLIALAVIILIGCLPLGVKGCYAASGPDVAIIIGPARIPVYPAKTKKNKKENHI